jgi:Leucine-rich repeat (LRR) protein
LNLIGNLIEELPPELGRLRKLEMMALSFNPLERIPDEITSIQSLKPEYGEFLGYTKLCRASLSPRVLNWLDQFFPKWKQGANCPAQ